MKRLHQITGTAVLLFGIALPTAQSQMLSGSFDFTTGTNGANSFILNEESGLLGGDGNVITATFDNFVGGGSGGANTAGVNGNGIVFDSATTSNTYGFDLTFSSNIQDIVITGYTITRSTGVFDDVPVVVSLSIGSTSGLSMADGAAPIYHTLSEAVSAGIPVTFTDSSGPGSLSGDAAIGSITFTAMAAVPEPSTYALFAGFLALAVIIRRRVRA